MADFYQTLGVPADAREADIRQAYRERSKRLHPDASGTNEQMARLNQAYAVLKDPVSRSVYDAGRLPQLHRTRTRRSPMPPGPVMQPVAQSFVRGEFLPLDALLGVSLDRLQLALEVLELTPADTARIAEWNLALGQANLNLETVASRLARAEWPVELKVGCQTYGRAVRLLSDALWDFGSAGPLPGAAQFTEARAELVAGRKLLGSARASFAL